ncbi:MAG: hypothetical protein GY714_03985 [Desulfobacterales bacterium]|nr:hypothetical protein [Desulfobacterales bacterium]
MPGFQEILILAGIVFLIFFIPRITRKTKKKTIVKTDVKLVHWKIRLLIVLSFTWLSIAAIYYKVWTGAFVEFLKFGLFPVFGVWGLYWVLQGFSKKS